MDLGQRNFGIIDIDIEAERLYSAQYDKYAKFLNGVQSSSTVAPLMPSESITMTRTFCECEVVAATNAASSIGRTSTEDHDAGHHSP